jgi:hypothetical protein
MDGEITMKTQVQIKKVATSTQVDLDTRTPSGRKLPY